MSTTPRRLPSRAPLPISAARSSAARSIAARSAALVAALAGGLLVGPSAAQADEPLKLRDTFSGNLDFVITGATMAADTDDDNKVDSPDQPAMATVAGLPDDALLKTARLYWAASVSPSMCGDENKLDKEVELTVPGGDPETVTADGCYCSIGAQSYDMQLCYAVVTEMIVDIEGAYAVDGLDALLDNGDTHNASFSLVMVYESEDADPRRVGVYDGLTTMVKSSNPTETISLMGVEIDQPPQGELAWYALEGDVNGNKDEFVEVTGQPGGLTHTPTDAINPPNNPFNQTINTTIPPQTGTIGVDVDRFSISPALSAGDDTIDVTYSADLDKYWIAVNIIGVDVFEPALFPGSGKAWSLTDDADENGAPTVGDTVTYTITLKNSGNAPATIHVKDTIPAEAASWAAGELCGGTLVDSPDTFEVTGVEVAVDASCELTFTVVIDEIADQTMMANTAIANLGNGIDSPLIADDAELRRDGDGDGVFDNDDNCPDTVNEDQADADDDGIGDACEGDSSTTDSDAGSDSDSAGTDGTDGTSDTSGSAGETDASGTSDSGSGTGGVDTATATASATASAGETDASDSATAGVDTSTDGVDEDGCGCRSGGDPTPAPWLMVVGLTGLALRRRR